MLKKKFIPKILKKHIKIDIKSHLPDAIEIDFPSEKSWIFIWFAKSNKNICFSASYTTYNNERTQKNRKIHTKNFDTLEEALNALTKEVVKQNLKNIFIHH
jgi:NAD-dependent SIR2 family protein deacetylase